MFDEKMRVVKDMTFNPVAQLLQHISPTVFTGMGLVTGIAAAIALMAAALYRWPRSLAAQPHSGWIGWGCGTDGWAAKRFGRLSRYCG